MAWIATRTESGRREPRPRKRLRCSQAAAGEAVSNTGVVRKQTRSGGTGLPRGMAQAAIDNADQPAIRQFQPRMGMMHRSPSGTRFTPNPFETGLDGAAPLPRCVSGPG